MRFRHGMGTSAIIVSFYVLSDGKWTQYMGTNLFWEHDREYITVFARKPFFVDLEVRIFA